MELTRRDAVAALGAVGAGGVGAVGVQRYATGDEGDREEEVSETLVAAAEVLYPSTVDGVREFVETFMAGRLDDGAHAEGVREAVSALETRANAWYDDSFQALSTEDRDSLLEETGADTADENPDGTPAERIRYYIVNELLMALYASPTGGELVGIENPQGHAGGLDTYQRGPNA
jgi:hypothetical protein